MQLLSDLNETEGITVLLVTHEPDMAAFLCAPLHSVRGWTN